MTKEDYDRNVEQLLVDKCKAELEVEILNNMIDRIKKYCFKRMSELNNIKEKDKDKKLQDFCDNKINAFLEIITEIKT